MKNFLLSLGLTMVFVAPLSATGYGEFGMAFQHPASEQATDQVKFVEFGETKSFKLFERNLGVGGWTDVTHYPGARTSPYGVAELGLETRRDGVYMNYLIGPAWVLRPDSMLGGHFQVSHEIGIGVRDKRGVAIGIVIKHFSDGGLTPVNYGRNFAGIRAKF